MVYNLKQQYGSQFKFSNCKTNLEYFLENNNCRILLERRYMYCCNDCQITRSASWLDDVEVLLKMDKYHCEIVKAVEEKDYKDSSCEYFSIDGYEYLPIVRASETYNPPHDELDYKDLDGILKYIIPDQQNEKHELLTELEYNWMVSNPIIEDEGLDIINMKELDTKVGFNLLSYFLGFGIQLEDFKMSKAEIRLKSYISSHYLLKVKNIKSDPFLKNWGDYKFLPIRMLQNAEYEFEFEYHLEIMGKCLPVFSLNVDKENRSYRYYDEIYSYFDSYLSNCLGCKISPKIEKSNFHKSKSS